MEAYFLAIIAALCFGIGAVLQKRGVEKISIKSTWEILKNLKFLIKQILNRYFLLGSLIAFFGVLVSWRALSIGELSIVQPLLNLNIIVVWLLGILYLHEKIQFREWVALIIIFLGVFALGFSL